MPSLENTDISCGIRTMSGLCRNVNNFNARDRIPPKQLLLEAFNSDAQWQYSWSEDWDGLPTTASQIKFGAVLFSDSVRRGNGQRLATYITKQGLGTIIKSNKFRNPNTRRDIQAWIWEIDREALVAWIKKNSPPEPEYDDDYDDQWY